MTRIYQQEYPGILELWLFTNSARRTAPRHTVADE